MSTSSERIEVFQDTLNWIENDIELSASVIYSKEHTKIYWENDYPEFDGAKECDTEVTVTRDRSYQAAMRLAAPDLRDKSNHYAPLVGGGTFMKNAELFGYHVKRAIHVLTCAAAQGADILVLGAFGCGAFRNDPEVVARAYKVAIGEFPKVFKKIEFAVYCSPADQKNYETFSRVLG